LESMKDVQRECSASVTKSVYPINSSHLVFEGSPMPGGDENRLKPELIKLPSPCNSLSPFKKLP
jgi:hypothetical protein